MIKIGMPSWVYKNFYGIKTSYAEYIRSIGELVMLNPDDPCRDDLDLLILPGGADVTPHQHKISKLSLMTGSSNPLLEYFDNKVLPDYINQETPIFGICRGAQKLWSLFGGAINQHIDDHEQSSYDTDECHGLYFVDKEYDTIKVNVTSRHHQAMYVSKDTNPDLEVIAYATEEKLKPVSKILTYRPDIVEAFRVKGRQIAGVQYHPEDNRDDSFTPIIIDKLLNKNL